MGVVISGFGVRRKLRVIYFSVFSPWLLISDEDCVPDSTVYSVFGVEAHVVDGFCLRECSYPAHYGDDVSRFRRKVGFWGLAFIERLLRSHISSFSAITYKISTDFYKWLSILSLSAQDHYVEVTTDLGKELCFMRLEDAILEVAPEKGFRTHKSCSNSR